MFKLNYFKKSDSICGSDFENNRKTEHINLLQVSSLSELKAFRLPFSGKYVGDYSILSMLNGDKFAVDKKEYQRIKTKLNV
jgi:hypothetical protein